MKTFPVRLDDADRKLRPDCPTEIPFHLIAAHAHQCRVNFGRTPEEIATGGGLTPWEIRGVVHGLDRNADLHNHPAPGSRLNVGVDLIRAMVPEEGEDEPAWARRPE